MLQTSCLLSSTFPFSVSPTPKILLSPKITISLSAFPRRRPIIEPWLAQAQEATTNFAFTTSAAPEKRPIELTQSIFANTDDPSLFEVSTSVLLTGATAVFLFRSLRRRAKRPAELKFRSTGAKKSLKEEALDNLKAMGSSSFEAKAPSSPVQALLGAISAGVIALILCKFTTTVEASLNRQTVSDNFSLAINSFMENSSSNETEKEGERQSGSLNSTVENATDSTELNNSKKDQSSDNTQLREEET